MPSDKNPYVADVILVYIVCGLGPPWAYLVGDTSSNVLSGIAARLFLGAGLTGAFFALPLILKLVVLFTNITCLGLFCISASPTSHVWDSSAFQPPQFSA